MFLRGRQNKGAHGRGSLSATGASEGCVGGAPPRHGVGAQQGGLPGSRNSPGKGSENLRDRMFLIK